MKLADKVLISLLNNNEIQNIFYLSEFQDGKMIEVNNPKQIISTAYPQLIKKLRAQKHKRIINTTLFLLDKGSDVLDFAYDNLTIDNRRLLLLLYILVDDKDVSLPSLTSFLRVSKNTIVNDLNYLRQSAYTQKIKIIYSRKVGYCVEGEELDKRNAIIHIIDELLKKQIGSLLLFKFNFMTKDIFSLIRRRLNRVEKRLSYNYTYENYERLPFILLFLLQRIKIAPLTSPLSTDLKNIQELNYYDEVKNMFWDFDFLNKNDLSYLILLVLSSNVILSSNQSFNYEDNDLFEKLSESLNSFLFKFEYKYGIRFSDKSSLKEKLMQHLVPAFFRNTLGLQISSKVTSQFIAEYVDFFVVVVKEISTFSSLFPNPFANDELAFITMILVSHISPDDEFVLDQQLTGVVVCHSGASISTLVKKELENIFPNIYFTRTISYRDYSNSEINEDFIFSLIPLDNAYLVSPLLSEAEKNKLIEKVYKDIQEDDYKKAKLYYSKIANYIDDSNKQEVFQELLHLNKKPLEIGEQKKYNIFDNKEQITFHREPLKWNAVIPIVFKELLQRRSIKQSYINKCQLIFKKDYKYQLIGPNVYIPHAAPEDGVIECDVQVHIFKEGVLYSPDNKPIQMMIALAPSKDNQHVDWILNVNQILKNKTLKKYIYNSWNKEEIFDVLKLEMKGENKSDIS